MPRGTKFTPGPWHVVPYGDGDSLVICMDEAGYHRIAFMATPNCRDDARRRQQWSEIEANANLIGAAPDLYEALSNARELVNKWCHTQGNSKDVFDQYVRPIDVALAKARGE